MKILATVVFTLIVFAFFAVAVSLGRLFGRKRTRRCACAESKAVMKTFFEREKAARRAALYHPERVNPQDLPILSPELTEKPKTVPQ